MAAIPNRPPGLDFDFGGGTSEMPCMLIGRELFAEIA